MKNDAEKSSAGLPSHTPGHEGSLILSVASLVNSMGSTQIAMADLMQSINRLAQSNEMLVQAMAEAEGVDPDDIPATVGLNGRPL